MDTIGTLQGHIAGHIGKCPKKCPLSVPELDIYLDVKTLIYKGSGKKVSQVAHLFPLVGFNHMKKLKRGEIYGNI